MATQTIAQQYTTETKKLETQATTQRERIRAEARKARIGLADIRPRSVVISQIPGKVTLAPSIAKDTQKAREAIDKWEREQLEALLSAHSEASEELGAAKKHAEIERKEAVKQAELEAKHYVPEGVVELITGEYVGIAEFNKLTKEQQDLLRAVGVQQFNVEQEAITRRELAKFVKLSTGEYIDKKEFGKLSEVRQGLLRAVGTEEYNKMLSDPKQQFDLALKEGSIKKGSIYVGVKNGGFEYTPPVTDIPPMTESEARVEFNKWKVAGEASDGTPIPEDATFVGIKGGQIELSIPAPVLTASEQFDYWLENDPDAPSDAVFIGEKDGGFEYTSPSMAQVEISTATGKVTMLQSEWEALSAPEQLGVSMERQPSVGEYEAHVLQEKELETDWWKGIFFPTGTLDSPEIQMARREAREEWYAVYADTTAARLGAIGLWTAETGTPFPMPGVKMFHSGIGREHITTPEWVQTGIAPVAYAFPIMRGVPLLATSGLMAGGMGYLTAESWEEATPMERILGIGATALAASPLLFKGGGLVASRARLYTVGMKGPIVKTRIPVSGVKVKGLTRLEQTPGGTFIRLQKPSISRISEGFYKFPVKPRSPVTVKWGAGLQRAGLSAKVEKLAFKSGAAAEKLRILTARQKIAMKLGFQKDPLAPSRYASALKLKQAQIQAQLADTKFINSLRNLGLTSKQIKLIEKVTGYKGLEPLMRNVQDASTVLKEAWAIAEKTEVGTPAHLKALRNVERARAKLATAVNKLDDVLQPRYVESAHPGWARVIDDATADVLRASVTYDEAIVAARTMVPSVAKEALRETRIALENAKARLDAFIRARDMGLSPPSITGYSKLWKPGPTSAGREPYMGEPGGTSFSPLSPAEKARVQAIARESRAKAEVYVPREVETGAISGVGTRSQIAVAEPTTTLRITAPGLAETVAEPATALRTVAPRLTEAPSYQLSLFPQYAKVSEVLPVTGYPSLVPTLTRGIVPVGVSLPIVTTALAPAEMPVVVPATIEEAITELAISEEQLAGTKPLTTGQTKIIARAAEMTQAQVTAMAKVGTLINLLTNTSIAINIRGQLQGLTITEQEALIEGAAEFESVAPTTVVAKTETKLATRTEPVTRVEPKITTKIRTKLGFFTLPPLPGGDQEDLLRKTGMVLVKARLGDKEYSGKVASSLSGGLKTQTISQVPTTLENMSPGIYTLRYISGKPTSSVYKNIKPSSIRVLKKGEQITFTIMFIAVKEKVEEKIETAPKEFRDIMGKIPALQVTLPTGIMAEALEAEEVPTPFGMKERKVITRRKHYKMGEIELTPEDFYNKQKAEYGAERRGYLTEGRKKALVRPPEAINGVIL